MHKMAIFQRFSRTCSENPALAKMLIVFTVSGGGLMAYSRAKSDNDMNIVDATDANGKKKRVVVLGTGWAATSFLKNLKNSSYDVQVISPRNYFAFTPLLPSVTCGTVEARSIVEPLRNIVRNFCLDSSFNRGCERVRQTGAMVVKTGAMVVNVSDKEISTKEVKNGAISSMPYGMAVWSTGIGTRPVILNFMKEIGQANRRALATDEWLRVEGCDSIYALGDCATINQRKVMEDIWAIFGKADKDNSGSLTVKEFQEVLTDIRERYPQVGLYLKNKQMRSLVDLLKDSNGNSVNDSVQVNLENFKSALSQVDSQMKNLPATTQVAAQQGTYLADCFNRMEKCENNPEGPLRFRGEGRHRFRPFRYKHLGQFAPLGGEQTAAQLPGDWVSIGHNTQWLWYSVYASKLVSWRTRALVVSDWGRRFVFGRDSSCI